MLRSLCDDVVISIQVQNSKKRQIALHQGVRQGDVISPNLFAIALKDIFKTRNWNGQGIYINGEYNSHLRFADDIVVMAESL